MKGNIKIMKPYKYAVFDLDGTILDTAEDLADSVNHALLLHGFPLRSLDEVKLFIGNGVSNLISRAVPEGITDQQFSDVFSAFRNHYATNMINKTAPFPGIKELLLELKKREVKVSIASNKYQKGVEELCERYFPGLYTAAFGEREGVKRKPDPSIIFSAMERMGANAKETIYIGDSEVDSETAKNAGIDFIGVSWGLRPKSLLIDSGAVTVVDNTEQLLEFF